MVISILIPLAFLALGAFVFAITKNNAELKEMGKLTFFAGVLVLCFVLATKHISL